MSPDKYHATLDECLGMIWAAQLALEQAFDALADAHVAIRAAQSADRLNAKLLSAKKSDDAA